MRLASLTLATLVLLGSATATAAQEPVGTDEPTPTATPGAPSPTSPSPTTSPAPTASTTPSPAPTTSAVAPRAEASSPDPTASPSTTPTEPPQHEALRAAVAAAADAEARLPLGPDTTATCPPDATVLAFAPVPEGAFTVGGYVEPLIEPSADAPDRATGIATCGDSDFAVAGFDAFRTDQGWDVFFVSPLIESGHDHEELPDGVQPDELSEPFALDKSATTFDAATFESATAEAASTASASASTAAIPDPPHWPSDMDRTAEALSSSDPQDTCDPTAKPGARALTDLLTRTYGTTNYGISRDCSIGGRSEHKEGRAVDWMIDSYDSTERQMGDAFTSWILSRDPWGNDYAGMRRLGIMYMIWNRQSIYSWAVDEGWRDYTGASPHTDHVHFSMTWPGARCQTSFWEATGCTGDVGNATVVSNNDGIDDVVLFRNSDRRVVSLQVGENGINSTTWWTTWQRRWTDMVTADLDGDGAADDLLLYNADTGAYSMQSFHNGVPRGITQGTWWTDWSITAGDFDGNGVTDDLLLIRPDRRYNITHVGRSGATDLQSTGTFRRSWTSVVAADLDGDGRDDDFLLYNRVTGAYSMQRVVNGRQTTHRDGQWGKGWDVFVPGDHDGNGAHDDLMIYRHFDRRFNLTHVRSNGTTDPQHVGYWQRSWDALTPADLDDDGVVNDVLMYNDATGAYSMQHLSRHGASGVNHSTWSSGWELLPAGEFN